MISPEEISGIATNQFDELVIRPLRVNVIRLGRNPSLDLNAATKQMTKTKMHA